jgi:ribosome biogenesis GTPase A
MIKKKRFILVINKQDKADHYKATRYVYVVQNASEKKSFRLRSILGKVLLL